MERFTDWIDDAKTEVSVLNYKMRDAMLRLAAYEDTGLMPEEIMDGRTLTGWIPVDERLPDVKIPVDFNRQTYSDYGKCFLITDRRGSVYTATFHVIANKFDYDAVAWMPLPEPYKVDK